MTNETRQGDETGRKEWDGCCAGVDAGEKRRAVGDGDLGHQFIAKRERWMCTIWVVSSTIG